MTLRRKTVIPPPPPDAPQSEEERIAAERLRIWGTPPQTLIPVAKVVERKQGCWNCLSFDAGDLAIQHYKRRRLGDLRRLLEAGKPLDAAEAGLAKSDALFMPPKTGMCLKGKAGTDFCSPRYLCNAWTGRVNPKSHPGEASDPLPLELRDRLGKGFAPGGGDRE